MGELFGSGSLGSSGAGIVGTCGKCSLWETVQLVGVGINVICKVNFTLTGGIAVLPEDWCSGASISERQSWRSAKVGIGEGRGLACLCQYMIGQLVHGGVGGLKGAVLSMKYWDNWLRFGVWSKGNSKV